MVTGCLQRGAHVNGSAGTAESADKSNRPARGESRAGRENQAAEPGFVLTGARVGQGGASASAPDTAAKRPQTPQTPSEKAGETSSAQPGSADAQRADSAARATVRQPRLGVRPVGVTVDELAKHVNRRVEIAGTMSAADAAAVAAGRGIAGSSDTTNASGSTGAAIGADGMRATGGTTKRPGSESVPGTPTPANWPSIGAASIRTIADACTGGSS